MLVMILEKVPASLRGELSKWMIEPKAGIFLGRLTGRVRDRLWEKATENARAGACLQIWSTNNEQGFEIRSHGDTSRTIVDLEGLYVVSIPKK